MSTYPSIPYSPAPSPPEGVHGDWSGELYDYALILEASARRKEAEAEKEHYKVKDYYRCAGDLIQYSRKDKDAELLLAYADWLFKVNDMIAVRSTVEVLRRNHEGPVLHLVTAHRINCCHLVSDALVKRGRTNCDENSDYAYLAFNDPEMLGKILLVVSEGVHGLANVIERLGVMEGIQPALVDGAL